MQIDFKNINIMKTTEANQLRETYCPPEIQTVIFAVQNIICITSNQNESTTEEDLF